MATAKQKIKIRFKIWDRRFEAVSFQDKETLKAIRKDDSEYLEEHIQRMPTELRPYLLCYDWCERGKSMACFYFSSGRWYWRSLDIDSHDYEHLSRLIIVRRLS